MKTNNTEDSFYKYVELGKKYISTDEVGKRIVTKLTEKLERQVLKSLLKQAHLKTDRKLVISSNINLKNALKEEVAFLWAIGFASGILNRK